MTLFADLGPALPYAVLAFLFGAGIAFVATPLVRFVAIRLEMVDEPDARRVNVRPVARGGGIAIVIAFAPVALAVLLLNDREGVMSLPASLDGPQLVALLAGGVAAALLGLIDDLLQVRARWQLAGQLLLAGWAAALGITIPFVTNPIGPDFRLEGIVAVVFTLFWIVGMINAINFIDGLDGLSSGIALIAAVTIGVISVEKFNQPLVAVLCFTLAGALLGFLRWNFHPAAIFAGTSGTMFIGFTLALLSIVGTAKVAIALLVLGVPIIDTFWIIVRRLMTKRAPFSPDRGHFHHRLLDLGLSHRQAVLLIYALCIGLAVLAYALSGQGQLYAFLGVFFGLGIIVTIMARQSLDATGLEAESYETHDEVTLQPDETVGEAPAPPSDARAETSLAARAELADGPRASRHDVHR
ncbi:MAG TPA: MraY family glycosyltransferase [Candidatus Limnocylindrales bacterium]|nr:MraY family glycosyltransferase [Candidatus Limnocylindrales bacterium]